MTDLLGESVGSSAVVPGDESHSQAHVMQHLDHL